MAKSMFVVAETKNNDGSYPVYTWEIANDYGRFCFLDFQTIDLGGEDVDLPISKAHAVRIRDSSCEILYLSKHKLSTNKPNALRDWEKQLANLVRCLLDELDK